jgi:hypothetical protein
MPQTARDNSQTLLHDRAPASQSQRVNTTGRLSDLKSIEIGTAFLILFEKTILCEKF